MRMKAIPLFIGMNSATERRLGVAMGPVLHVCRLAKSVKSAVRLQS